MVVFKKIFKKLKGMQKGTESFVILHFESCHEYITNFIFVTFLADHLDVVGCMPGIRLPVEVYACSFRSDEQSITKLLQACSFVTISLCSFSNAYNFLSTKTIAKQSKENKRCRKSPTCLPSWKFQVS